MTKVSATLSNFRQSPRKMRLVANLIRGKKVSDVLVQLDFVTKKATNPIKNLVLSAVANAKNLEIPTEDLIVKSITVNEGKTLYRRIPAARGSAHPIRKRTSLIYIELGDPVISKNKKIKVLKEEKEESKEGLKKETSNKKVKTEVKKSKMTPKPEDSPKTSKK